MNRRDFYVKELIPLSEGGLFEPLKFTLKFQQTPAQIQLLTCSVALLSAGLCEQYAVATDHRGRNSGENFCHFATIAERATK